MTTPSPPLAPAYPGKKALDPTGCGWSGTTTSGPTYSDDAPFHDGGGVVNHGRDSLPTIFGAGDKAHRATRMRPAGQR